MSKTALYRIKFVNTPISTKKNPNFRADGIALRMRLMEAWYICERGGGCAGLIAAATGLALAAQRRWRRKSSAAPSRPIGRTNVSGCWRR